MPVVDPQALKQGGLVIKRLDANVPAISFYLIRQRINQQDSVQQWLFEQAQSICQKISARSDAFARSLGQTISTKN